MQAVGFGEGWNSFDSGHYMSARLRPEANTLEVSSLDLRLNHWNCSFGHSRDFPGEVRELTRFMLEYDAVAVAAVAAVLHRFAFPVG